MRFILIIQAVLMFLPALVYASPPTLESLYTNPEEKRLSEAIIFYNSANTCETCPATINNLIAVLRQNYQGKLHAYLIDTAQHPEFISAFKLHGPLTLVAIRLSDGAAFGYRKLSGLQSLNGNMPAFARRVKEFINNFLDF